MVGAKQAEKIASTGDSIETLETCGGVYLSDAVKAEALKLAGEAV